MWCVETEASRYIVKLCGHQPERPQSCFWLGLRDLFGCIPASELSAQPALVAHLQQRSPIPVPQIFHVEPYGSRNAPPFLLLEHMPGEALCDREFFARHPACAHQFGQYIGTLHAHQCETWGNFPQTASFASDEFPQRFVHTLRQLVWFAWQDDAEVSQILASYLNEAEQLPSLTHLSLIMPDISPSQFLYEQGHLSAIIDLESYVWGPRELELVAIELLLTSGDAFREGYESVCGDFPQLAAVRRVFRFFYYLLYHAPPKGLRYWIDAPIVFP